MILSLPIFHLLLVAPDQERLGELIHFTRAAALSQLQGEAAEVFQISTSSSDTALELFMHAEEKGKMISAILFSHTTPNDITDFADYTIERHYPVPIFNFNPEIGNGKSESTEMPQLDLCGVRSFVQADLDSGAFLSEIGHCLAWTGHLVKRFKKDQFSSIAKGARFYSHEIRNPLTNIDISTSELKSERTAYSSAPSAFIQLIDKNSRRINELLGTILQNTRTEDLIMDRVLLDDVVESVLAASSSRFPHVEFIYEPSGCIVKGDEEKLGAALYHLLVNSAEACLSRGDRGMIHLSIIRKGNKVLLSVVDNGTGVSATDRAYIFEPFFTTKTKSPGLGLSAAEDIVHRHQGLIYFENNVSGGSSFFIQLPAMHRDSFHS